MLLNGVIVIKSIRRCSLFLQCPLPWFLLASASQSMAEGVPQLAMLMSLKQIRGLSHHVQGD